MTHSYIDIQRHRNIKMQNIILTVIGIIVLAYLCARGNYYMQQNPDTPVFLGMFIALSNINKEPLAISFQGDFLKIFLITGTIVGVMLWFNYDTRYLNRHYKDGEQYGTSAFQTETTIKDYNRKYTEPYGKPYADGNENTILSQNCCLSTNIDHTRLNNNSVIIGSPGSGKSRNVVIPNILQVHGSYVITDPSGELLRSTGRFLEEQGYDIRVFNLIDMAHSHCYNPFNYIRKEEDVLTLLESLIQNTDGGVKSSDPFWPKAEKAVLSAIVFYLIRFQKKDKQNFPMVSKLLRQAKIDPRNTRTQLDVIFDEVRQFDENDICVKQYDIFKNASEKTAQSILISAASRLAPFNFEAVENLTSQDDMDFISIGDRPTAVFITVPQGNNAYAFLVNMLYSQIFDTLYYHAQMDHGDSRLPLDVRFVLDEFANLGVIPDFQNKLTTMRKYGMYCMIFIQSVNQIKTLYKDDWETLMDACDTTVFLRGNGLSSLKDISEKLGKQTIRVRDNSSSRSSKGGSSSTSFKYAERSLLNVDEVRRLKKGYCIVIISGENPFNDKKYNPEKHPNYKLLGNIRTGTRLYRFDYCNTKPHSLDKLEEARKRIQENTLKKSAEAKRPSEKAYKTNTVMPANKNMTAQEKKNLETAVAAQTVIMPVNKEEAVKQGGTVTEVRGGIAAVSAGRPKGKVASASNRANKPTLAPKLTRSQNEILDDFSDLF